MYSGVIRVVIGVVGSVVHTRKQGERSEEHNRGVGCCVAEKWLKRVQGAMGCWKGDRSVSEVRTLRVCLPGVVTWI